MYVYMKKQLFLNINIPLKRIIRAHVFHVATQLKKSGKLFKATQKGEQKSIESDSTTRHNLRKKE